MDLLVGEDDGDGEADDAGAGVTMLPAVEEGDEGDDDDTKQSDLVRAIGGDERLAKLAEQLAGDECFARFELEVRRQPEQTMRYARWDDGAVLWASDAHRPEGFSDDGGDTGDAPRDAAAGPAAAEAPGASPSACLAVGPRGSTGLEAEARGVPPCGRCGAARRFELQVMPQILHFLREGGEDEDGAAAAASASASAPSDGPSSRGAETAGEAGPAGEGSGAAGEETDFSTLVVFTCSAACETGEPGLGACSREAVWVQAE